MQFKAMDQLVHELRPYPNLRHSGFEWLGYLPPHWQIRRIKDLFRESDQRCGDDKGELLTFSRRHGIVRHADISTRQRSAENLSRYKVCKSGDLVMNRMQAWSGMLAISQVDGVVSPDYSVFVPTDRYNLRVEYFRHLFTTPKLVAQFARLSKGIGSGFNRLYTPDFGAIHIPVPSFDEQCEIARYLARIDRQIRDIIGVQKELVGLLKEYRRFIIYQTITGQIDVLTGRPYSRYGDSGIDGLVTFPSHWKVMRLKDWVHINQAVLSENTDSRYGFRYLDVSSVSSGCLVKNPVHIQFKDAPSRARRIVKCGDTIVSTVRTYLKAVWHVEGLCDDLIVSTGFAVLSPSKSVLPKYLSLYCQSDLFTDRVTSESVGIAYPAISPTVLASLKVVVPPLPEQTAIASFLDDVLSKVTTVITNIERKSDLLNEYRTCLISDVVTGQVDVRDAVNLIP